MCFPENRENNREMKIIREFQRFSSSVSVVISACCRKIRRSHGTGNNREYLDMCGKTLLHPPLISRIIIL
jgi:hypothetical protein